MKDIDGILSRVLRIKAEDLRDDMSMEEISSWDSLSHMDLVVSLEEAYNLEFTMDEIMELRSIAKIRKIIREKQTC
ncbi:acyl carrier protein [Gammaproteobacteria bacterium]|nr:acyl carrier protein [Gammaproteobacteria bacterium]